ncbi:type IV secretory system conjugative DNA transfer family protein [uncultured Arcobacter sp.]|uniref:type IV secretory system conjugative DNA transfer family protein n=1 Tax=uncultured Arcobacter sp. TaxID=165434 RepID=UPI002615E1EB|nr:type IV secretory system conjugative DNA transfer family protein [uncultured Arcobacter sp.]
MELLALILILIIILPLMNKQFRKFGIQFLNPLSWLFSFLSQPPIKSDGMMSKQDEIKTFSRFNDGLLVDGKNKRLSSKESFNHLALFSRTGGGKTTSYVLPNIYKLASGNCSMVITDLSGEIYDKTSAYLHNQGFKIYVLDPKNLDESIRYNPLEYAKDSMSIDMVSEILIASSGLKGTKAEDKIWSDGAKNFISILIKVLNETHDKRYMNLANVRYMLNNFGKVGEPLDEFIKRYADDKTFSEYKGFISGNEKTIQSFISTASVALSPIGINDNLEKLTYSHSIDFKKFREEKSVVFIKIEQQYQEQYSFLLNLFYAQLFNVMMDKLPSAKDLHLYCLLDEFGNMNIPRFSSIITTIRKYNVSISIILQNINQLIKQYSQNEAKTILDGGIASKLIYSGADLDLASDLEKMFGHKETLKKQADGTNYYDKESVMNISEIRTMKDNEALFVYANKKPLKMSVRPYYKDMMYNSFSKMKPYTINGINRYDSVQYVDLENVEW